MKSFNQVSGFLSYAVTSLQRNLYKKAAISFMALSMGFASGCQPHSDSEIKSDTTGASSEGFLSPEDIVKRIKEPYLAAGAGDILNPETGEAATMTTRQELEKVLSPVVYDISDNNQGINLTDASDSVDLRQWDTPVKNQGAEGLCTAFATASAMENLAKQKTSRNFDLSERHLWELYRSGTVYDSTAAAANSFVTSETTWPYNSRSPVASLEQNKVMRISKYNLQRQGFSIQQVIKSLKDKKPIVFGMSPSPVAFQGVVKGVDNSNPYMGHALAMVGFIHDPRINGGGYFILKNSWGNRYGDKGYLYMPVDICKIASCYANTVLDVEIAGDNATPAAVTPSTPAAVTPSTPAAVTPSTPAAKASCTGVNGTTSYKHGAVTTYNGGTYTCNNGKWDYSSSTNTAASCLDTYGYRYNHGSRVAFAQGTYTCNNGNWYQ